MKNFFSKDKEDKDNEKKAVLLTLMTVFIVFLWLFYHTAFTYQDPPEEYGMEVNFGTTDFGSGDDQPLEELATQPVEETVPEDPVDEPVEEPVEEVVEEAVETPTEEVITEDTTEDVPEVPEVKDPPKEKPVEKPVEKPKEEPKKPVEKPVEKPAEKPKPKPKPKPDKATSDALSSVLNGPPAEGKATGSEGDDSKPGDKGKENGDPNAPDYYTNPGNGSGGNYQLIGRLPLRRPLPHYNCNKEGRVVVAIKVNRQGKVIEAVPGAKGSTTTEKCLLDQAKIAALKTKWQPAGNAPEKQIGKIIYNFSLH